MIEAIRNALITIITIMAIVAIFFIDPINQNIEYHFFADTKKMFGTHNFWNVFSNIPYLFIGLYGLLSLNKMLIIHEMKLAYMLFFLGITVVALGSGYYHLLPNNYTLVWDRLPMTVAFMSLFSIVIAEFINIKKGKLLLFPFLILGVLSVLYWQWTEVNGMGDLRFYALIQFLPIIFIPLIILTSTSQYDNAKGYWFVLLFYVIAKVLEHFDGQVYTLFSGFMSGHALKHMISAIGVLFLIRYYMERKIQVQPNSN